MSGSEVIIKSLQEHKIKNKIKTLPDDNYSIFCNNGYEGNTNILKVSPLKCIYYRSSHLFTFALAGGSSFISLIFDILLHSRPKILVFTGQQ